MIAQPSPNLSLTSLHFFLCSLFLFAFPSVFIPLLKGFLFLTAIFILFPLLSLLVFLHKMHHIPVSSPHSVLPLLLSIISRAPLQSVDPPGKQMWGPPAGCWEAGN